MSFGRGGLKPLVPDAAITTACLVPWADCFRDGAPGTAVALLLIEHHWATGTRNAILEAGGKPLMQGFLTVDGMALIGAELQATAEAIVAIELAEAVEAEALARSIEALATIEIAQEIEAAVIARTVLGLVEHGFIDGADIVDAVDALVAPEIVQPAIANNRSL